MPNRQDAIVNRVLYPEAKKRIREHVENFFTALLFQAKLEAFNVKAETVLVAHVDEAYNKIISIRKRRTWVKQLCGIVGGALLGAFISMFANAYWAGNKPLMLVSTILGFLGILLIFISIS